jgi:hypothetical protein
VNTALREQLADAGVMLACVVTSQPDHLRFLQSTVDRLGIGERFHVVTPAGDDLKQVAALEYHYKHLSSNAETFERFCISRWYHLLSRAMVSKSRYVVHLDSDVLLSSDLQANDLIRPEVDLSLCVAANKEFPDLASGHVSVWKVEALAGFCDFVLGTYSSQEGSALLRHIYDERYLGRRPGGISDMTLLRLYWDAVEKKRNLLRPEAARACGHNVNTGESGDERQYRMRLGTTRIHRSGGTFTAQLGSDTVHLWALHFQGRAKMLMDSYAAPNVYKDVVSTIAYRAVVAARSVYNVARFRRS